MFKTSEATDKLDAAIAKAQAEIQPASKDKNNPAFKSKYADLTSVWDACRSALTKNQIAVTQWPVHSDDNRLHLVTRLACGGQWMMAEISIPTDKQNAHGYGSAITYAKRFGLSAAVGVVADEDDDGNAASSGANQQSATAPRAAAPKPADEPKAVKAREAYTRLRDAITAADSAEKVDAILKLQATTLAEIQEQSQTGHDQIMQLALARKDALSQKKAA
jgi:hypothetical protein